MRKGTHVLYFGELYTVYQKRGESVTIYKPDATCPEATMINTAATKVQPAPLEYGYIITSYTTSTGHDRVEITTFKNAWPFMDIPAGELDAHREEIQINTCGRAWFIDKRTNKDEERNQETPEPAQHTEEENTMKEIKRGDFTGIYSSIDGKPLYFTGVYSCMEYDGMPCVFLATDIHNNLTFCRWSQQDLNKRGYIIPPRPVEISKTAMQLIEKAGAVIRWTTAAERKAANTDHKRMSPYIITTAAGEYYTTGTCADVHEVLKAAKAATPAPLPEESNQDMRRFTIYTDNENGIDSRGAYKTKAEARMRLEKELDEDETSRGGFIYDEMRQKVTDIYNYFNLDKIPEQYRGTPTEHTTRKEREATRAMLESIIKAQEATTSAGTNADTETPTQGETAPQAATSEATTAPDQDNTSSTPEATQNGPTTAGTVPGEQDTPGSDTTPPRAQEANQEPGHAAGDHCGQAAEAITGRTTTPPQNPGHACENATGRTETPQAVQTTTPPHKRPHRGKTRAGPRHDGSQGPPRKVRFFDSMQKSGQKNGATGRDPFCSKKIQVFDPVLAETI